MDEKLIQEHEEEESDKPPSTTPRPERSWRVAVIANIKGETALPINGPADAGAEFDRPETVQEIQKAIESDGHHTEFFPADQLLPFELRAFQPDICFNIAEGIAGDAREAQVPALLEMLRIPYTASRVLANAVALDKTMTKRVWRDNNLPVAAFQEFIQGNEILGSEMEFPLFVKPAREGTGMGLDEQAIVWNRKELYRRVNWVIDNYSQPALVETFLPGREFTVGVLGRPDAARFSPHPELYASDGFHRFPIQEIDNSVSITPGIYGHTAKTLHTGEYGVPGFLCPANISQELSNELNRLAILGHKAIGALDISRIDFRMDAQGRPQLIEINSLPGLTPGFSDLCVLADTEGMPYKDLILEILYLGASRYGMLKPRAKRIKPYRVVEYSELVAIPYPQR